MTKAERLERDIKKLAEMKAHEDELRASGCRYIAGIDEVGRGPLAGPVYAACVVLPADFDVPGVNDSKKLSAKRRGELSEIIKERAVAYGIGIADNNEIDEINILEATKNAMKRAIDACNEALAATEDTSDAAGASNALDPLDGPDSPDVSAASDAHDMGSCGEASIDMLLIDAVKLDAGIPSESIIKGDEKSLSIAAASILAKVARDDYMTEMDSVYPGYDFAGNKGYGTAKHYEGLRAYGYTPIHRRSFLRKFEESGHHNPHGRRGQDSRNDSGGGADNQEQDDTNMASKKVYAVRNGRNTGIYETWDECKEQIEGFPGAEFKSFKDPEKAAQYLELGPGAPEPEEVFPEGVRAYVDGSYDAATGMFSCGVVMVRTDSEGNITTREFNQAFNDPEAAKQRNIAGEIMGAKLAVDFCLKQGIDAVGIYHDYEGIGKWADGVWKAKNPLTQAYSRYIGMARERMDITFVKVDAHTGNKYNEIADRLAKEALGISK